MLRASLRASEGAISIGWFGWRRHRWRTPALVAGRRLTRARTGNLLQPPCPGSSAVNESCYTFAYCSYSNVDFVCNGRCSIALGWSAVAACQAEAARTGHYYPFLRHYYIIITCYNSNNGSGITYLCIIISSLLRINTPVITSLLPVITVIMDH